MSHIQCIGGTSHSLCSTAQPGGEPPLVDPVPAELVQKTAVLDAVKGLGCVSGDK